MIDENVKRLNLLLIYELAIRTLTKEYQNGFNQLDDGVSEAIKLNWSEPIHRYTPELSFALHVPLSVLHSFSVELAIKALAFQQGKDLKGSHGLESNFRKLEDKSKHSIIKDFIDKNNTTKDDFYSEIKLNDSVFVNYRYPYENTKKEITSNLNFMGSLFNSILKEIDWTYKSE